jgi:hypothetical protein
MEALLTFVGAAILPAVVVAVGALVTVILVIEAILFFQDILNVGG